MSNTARNQSQPRQQNANSSGFPRRSTRDVRRMAENIGQKEFHRPGRWADKKEEEYLAQHQPTPQQRIQRKARRAKTWRKNTRQQKSEDATDVKDPTTTTTVVDTEKYQSTSTTQPKDDPMHNFTQGSRQFIKRRCQNIEHSGFPILCDVVYRQLREYAPRINREMTYTAFLHAMNTTLQVFIIDTAWNLNQEPRWQDEDQPLSCIPREMVIPAPIAEYLSLINTNITPTGDTVRINVPDAIVSGIEVPAADNVIAQSSGTFGPVTAASHNAYETNVSPFITMRNIQSQVQQQALTPLADDFVPAGFVPNRNLLGYVSYGQAGPDARALLAEYRFSEGNRIYARLRLCPALMVDVSGTLHRLSDKYKMVKIQDIV